MQVAREQAVRLQSHGAEPAFMIAEALARIRFETLPQATVRSAKRLILDSLASALAGVGSADCGALRELACEWGGAREATIIGSADRVPAPAAALVNGTMIQALDFDDTHDPSGTHVASTVLAAALAVAEARRLSGRELISSVVAGAELACRLGLSCEDKIGWTSTAVYGAFGAAAAAARALDLSPEATRHALGIVISQTAGTTQTAIDSPMSKHMQSGFAAKAGVLSAILAERGVTGVENVFEGKFGFFNLYKQGRYDRERLLTAWGEEFAVDALSLKPFPSCRATHGAIEAAIRLAPLVAGRPESVEGVRVTLPRTAYELVGKPFNAGGNPLIAAQFSAQYTVAAALLDGRISLRHFTLEAIGEPRLRLLADRVHIAEQDGNDFVPARVDLRLKGGEVHSLTIHHLKGGPMQPMTSDELRAKTEDCLRFAGLPAPMPRTEALIALIERVDQITDVSDLMGAIVLNRDASLNTIA